MDDFGLPPILGNPDVLLFEFFTLDKADIDIFYWQKCGFLS